MVRWIWDAMNDGNDHIGGKGRKVKCYVTMRWCDRRYRGRINRIGSGTSEVGQSRAHELLWCDAIVSEVRHHIGICRMQQWKYKRTFAMKILKIRDQFSIAMMPRTQSALALEISSLPDFLWCWHSSIHHYESVLEFLLFDWPQMLSMYKMA